VEMLSSPVDLVLIGQGMETAFLDTQKIS
jgi:hypothetical protein